jgi:hypothetical protein
VSSQPYDGSLPRPHEVVAAREHLLERYVCALIAADREPDHAGGGRLSRWIARPEFTRFYTQSAISDHLQEIRRANARFAVLPAFDADGGDPGRLSESNTRCTQLDATLAHNPALATLTTIHLPGGLTLGAIAALVGTALNRTGASSSVLWEVGYGVGTAALALLAASATLGGLAFAVKRKWFWDLGVYDAEHAAYCVAVISDGRDPPKGVPRHLWLIDALACVVAAVLAIGAHQRFHLDLDQWLVDVLVIGAVLGMGAVVGCQKRALRLRRDWADPSAGAEG